MTLKKPQYPPGMRQTLAGPHKVLFELADATHKPIPGASKLVEFIMPAPKGTHD